MSRQRYRGEAYVHGEEPRIGVLITNLGTPDAPTPPALRRYLAEFLWDPRVVEIPRPIWWLILHGIILRTRPKRSAAAYASVWSEAGSPLLAIGRRQRRGLEERLEAALPGPVSVALGMRYGRPAIADALAELHAAGARRIVVLPLYPQYASATTGSTFDAVAAALSRQRWVPELRFVGSYHDDPGYIEALATSVREHWAKHGEAERLLLSFHGIPKAGRDAGDPYFCHCLKTGRLVAEALGLPSERWRVSFQSRFGKAEWIQPYTDATLKAWGAEGVGRVDVICPGFSADCLETLEEIGEENRAYFQEAGGGEFHYIPALNDRADHLDALSALIQRQIAGWPEAETAPDGESAEASRRRALERGASR
ncbi:MAG: ferrochelatase [Pseudomonadota bacterium]